MKKNGHACRQVGFTLIELLVSISIIAILTVLASLSFSKAQKNGRDQRRINDLKSIQSAAEQYYLLNNNKYPTSTNIGWSGPNNQIILAKFPIDPKNTGGYIYTVNSLNDSGYCICALMEDSKNANYESNTDNCTSTVNAVYYCVKNQQ